MQSRLFCFGAPIFKPVLCLSIFFPFLPSGREFLRIKRQNDIHRLLFYRLFSNLFYILFHIRAFGRKFCAFGRFCLRLRALLFALICATSLRDLRRNAQLSRWAVSLPFNEAGAHQLKQDFPGLLLRTLQALREIFVPCEAFAARINEGSNFSKENAFPHR